MRADVTIEHTEGGSSHSLCVHTAVVEALAHCTASAPQRLSICEGMGGNKDKLFNELVGDELGCQSLLHDST